MKVIKVNSKKHFEKNIQNSRKLYSKVSCKDVEKYKKIILNHIKFEDNIKAICLASRTGREIDLFRLCFENEIIFKIIKFFEYKKNGFRNFFNFILKYKTDDIKFFQDKNQSSFIGVELNKELKRKDTLNISFDEIPKKYNNKFDIVYFNSLDHSKNPYLTARNIKKICKKNSFIILNFPGNQKSTTLDPVSGVNIEDVKKLFKNFKIIYSCKYGSKMRYDEYILKN